MHVQVEERRRRTILAHGFYAARVREVVPRGLGHAVGLHLETYYAVALVLVGAGVVLQVQPHVVVDVVVPVPLDAHGEAVHVHELPTVSSPDVARSRWKVVHYPVDQVLVVDHAPELVLVVLRERLLAQDLAGGVPQHLDLVRRVLDEVPREDLPQVLHAVLNLSWLAVGQDVVAVGQLRLHRGQLVDLEVDLAVLMVLDGRHSREVERAAGGGKDEARPCHPRNP
mmetsp:Transcript_132439/g.411722  ORF Transcript_132439/g.411722 Transcript_132439/m.411722 type:complete len:226 (-) Transcript_132439:37-714(-)